jgi:hypothetical protein
VAGRFDSAAGGCAGQQITGAHCCPPVRRNDRLQSLHDRRVEGTIHEERRDAILWSTLPQYLSSGVIEDHVFRPELRSTTLDNLELLHHALLRITRLSLDCRVMGSSFFDGRPRPHQLSLAAVLNR